MAELLLVASLKATLVLLLAGFVSLALWRRSAAQRHLVWVTAIVAILLLPGLQLALPTWPLPVGDGWPRLLAAPASDAPASAAPASGTSGTSEATAGTELGPDAAPPPPERAVPGHAATPAHTFSEKGAGNRGGRQPSGGTGVGPAAATARRLDLRSALLALWALGAAVALAPLAFAFLRIARIVRRAQSLDAPRWAALVERVAEAQGLERGRFVLRRAAGPVTPLTWGVWRPVVILPASCEGWSDAQAYEVLVHEAGHVRRHDCLTQLLASLACVLYWFHPLAWLAGRQMLTERERACDDQVLLAGARASDYASDLLELARAFGAPWSTSHVTTAMARRSQIAGRLLAVLDPHLDRRAIGRRALVGCAGLGLALLLPLASAMPLASEARPAGSGSAVEESTLATIAGLRGPMASGSAGDRSGSPGASEHAMRPLDLLAATRAVDLRERAYAAALAKGDLDTLADFYTSDAQVASPLSPVAYGRRSVRGALQQLVDAGVAQIAIEPGEQFAVGELLCRTGGVRYAQRAGAPSNAGRFMRLWKNEDGTWRIHRDWATR